MTALGINCSDREIPTTHTPAPRQMSQEERNYREAAARAEELWHEQRDIVGKFLDAVYTNGDYAPDWKKSQAMTLSAIEADKRKAELYECWDQNHPHAVEVGSRRFVDGDVVDDIHLECPVCGMRVNRLKSGTVEPGDEIPI